VITQTGETDRWSERSDAGPFTSTRSERVGPALIFERLWAQSGCQAVVQRRLARRPFGFPVERAVFLTVLHRARIARPSAGGSGTGCRGTEALDLHHLYRAMAWLGEALPEDAQGGRTPLTPRCTKDLIEEDLFAYRRDLFTTLDLVPGSADAPAQGGARGGPGPGGPLSRGLSTRCPQPHARGTDNEHIEVLIYPSALRSQNRSPDTGEHSHKIRSDVST
jgi:hypothetical protein